MNGEAKNMIWEIFLASLQALHEETYVDLLFYWSSRMTIEQWVEQSYNVVDFQFKILTKRSSIHKNSLGLATAKRRQAWNKFQKCNFMNI